MSTIRIPTSFNIDLEFEIPEFHLRLFAWLIDLVIIVILCLLLHQLLEALVPPSTDGPGLDAWAVQQLSLVPWLLYHLVSELSMNGQSLGKMAMRIRVISMTGGRPTTGQYVIRWLLRLVDFTLTLGAGALFSVIFTKYSQRLGDLAAGTILISTSSKIALEETIFMEVASDYVPRFPQVMQLSDRDLNTIRSLLQRAEAGSDFNIAAVAAEKVKTVLKIQTAMEPFEFLQTLLKDYNHLSVQ